MKIGPRLLLGVLVGCLTAAPVFAQGASSTSSLSGVVVDSDGGVVPGATVTVKNDATSATVATVVTNSVGRYVIPAIDPGTYTVTVTLSGFKTFVHSQVRILSATPVDLKAVLEIGQLSETVDVRANSELVRTNTPTVSSTVTTEFITSLPRNDRNALNFLIFLPGVDTVGGSARGSTISGLPQNTINISIDGINTGNNLQSGDGFFSLVVPRTDAVEEVTMTSAVSGADSSGQGAVQVRFVTRSGTNQYQTSLYEYFQHDTLNTNTFFNQLAGLPRPLRTIHTYGGRIGGPIFIPGLVDGRGRAFFFFNQEEVYQPNETRRSRTMINESALSGNFTYNTANPRTVNVLDLAAQNGHVSTPDPIIDALLRSIRSSTQTTGTVQAHSTNPNVETFNFLQRVASKRHNPTTRLDFNLTSRQRLSGTYYWQGYSDSPDTLNSADPVFPGMPLFGSQTSYRSTGSITHRWTFSSNLVNEILTGWQSSPVNFFKDITPDRFDNQGGFDLTLGFGLSDVTPGNFGNAPQVRNTSNWNVDQKLNWLKGSHSFTFGASFTRLRNWIDNYNVVPTMSLGLSQANDPANAMFTSANFPTASSGELNQARALYALLTGRVTSIGATARLQDNGLYEYNGNLLRRERQDDWGFFMQDSWRVRPNLTINYGLRYELQMPFVPTNATYSMSFLEDLCGPSGLGSGPGGRQCAMFQPGLFGNPDVVPTYVAYDPGNPGYDTDTNNLAPTVGIAWRPSVQSGFWRTLLGDPDLATITAGYTRTFNRERFDRFTGTFSGNPGATTPATRGTGSTQFPLVLPGESWPLLFRERERLGPPAFPERPTYPITASFNAGHDISIFDPDTEVPYTDSWTFGFQRSLDRDTAIEFRYVGNKNQKAWAFENWNLENIVENNFLNEFKNAMANLRANVDAGRGASFAYMGPGTGTSPLPIFLAHFSAQPLGNAGDASLYTSSQFTNSSWVNNLDPHFPDPYDVAADLWGEDDWRDNMLAAGLPLNFWVMNPLVDNANVRTPRDGSNYHSLQIDLRRRLSRGLVVQGSYTYGKRFDLSLPSSDFHLDYVPYYCTSNCIPHAIKVLWNYQIPVGRGRRFGTDMNRWVNGIIGNWEFSGAGRTQIQRYRITNTRIVGMSFDEAQSLFKQARIETDPITGTTTVWNMPEDIRINTRRAYNTDPTSPTLYPVGEEPTGRYFAPAIGPECFGLNPGDCAPDMFFNGPWYSEWDFKFVKRFPFATKASVDFSVEIFNAFNDTNFSHNMNPGGGANIFRITGQQSGARVGQLVWRVNF